MEEWKDILDYEGIYQVSNYGNVKRVETQMILKPRKHTGGYLTICLWKYGKEKYYFIHRLVAQSFIENTYRKKEVNHKDGIKTNNTLTNLEWVTPSENQKHAVMIGLKNKCKERLSKQVVDLWTGFFYDSLKEACFVNNFSYHAAKKQIECKLKTQRFEYV